MNNTTAKELCDFVLESIRLIRKRFENIHTSEIANAVRHRV